MMALYLVPPTNAPYVVNLLRIFSIPIMNKKEQAMSTQSRDIKRFILVMEVDVKQLELEMSYQEADPTFKLKSNEDIRQAVFEECGYITSSGISVESIQEEVV